MAESRQARTPVIMYHAVGHPVPGWKWPTMTTPVALFEKQVTLLAAKGYTPLSLDEYRDRQESGASGRLPEVALTFDDGYLDNWVFAYPILKRAGWRGTIYVNPEFIDPGESPRPNLEDVWAGRCAAADLQVHGFLNRAELRQLAESGVMEIGNHSMSHTWFPTGPRIVGWHHHGQSTPWLAWNARPDRKHAYLTEDQTDFVPAGTPIHENGRSLGIRRYFPDPALAEACVALAAANGGHDFVGRPEADARLRQAAEGRDRSGRFETDQEMLERFTYEIHESRRLLEDITGRPVQHFCWPGGAYCPESWPIADAADYTTICVASDDRERWNLDDARLVRRIGCGLYIAFGRNRFRTGDPGFLLAACEAQRGVANALWPMRWKKLLTAARHGFRPSVRKPA